MVVDNGVVTKSFVEAKAGDLKVSSAEAVLKAL
jgi:peroxiredoxin